VPSFRTFVVVIAILLPVSLALLIAPAVLTWRRSQARPPAPRSGWCRWYSLVAMAILLSTSSQLALRAAHRLYKPFYAPAESMAPTILKNDKFVADMRGGRSPRRGNVILIEANRLIRITRVVGLPGDRVQMRNGVPVVNGQAAQQRRAGTIQVLGFEGLSAATRLQERLPGEGGSHFIMTKATPPRSTTWTSGRCRPVTSSCSGTIGTAQPTAVCHRKGAVWA
jgi:signal peptidase I